MAKSIPLTNFAKYMREAEAIQRDLRESTVSPAAVRRAVEDLVDLAAKSLEEAAQVFEGLAMVVFALHPEVRRRRPREKRGPRAQMVRPAEAVAKASSPGRRRTRGRRHVHDKSRNRVRD